MLDCWKTLPGERPSFTTLRDRLDALIESYSSVEYMRLDLDHSKDYYSVSLSDGDTSHHGDEGDSIFGRRLSLPGDTGSDGMADRSGSSPESGLGLDSQTAAEWLKCRPSQETGTSTY